MAPGRRDADHIFERLRSGVVPERALEAFAVGIDRPKDEIGRLLDLTAAGEGVFKFLRGGYGCGKTFMARLAVLEAQARGFATSFVVVSVNDLQFHRFDEVYRKVVSALATEACPGGALGDIIDRWIATVEDGLIQAGGDENAPDFDAKVRTEIGAQLVAHTRGAVPEDFVRVLRTVFDLKQSGNLGDAGALLSWLAGSDNVAASAKKVAGIKGDISSRDALGYLHGIVQITKAAGYKGLLIVIDEVETLLRQRQDVRGRSLNGIRQILDAAPEYHGLFWLFTGTPEFFDVSRGVKGLQPLHDRIRFTTQGGFASVRQPQLELRPFDAARLKEVALKLREIYPAKDRPRLEARVPVSFVERLVAEVTKGLGGDVGIVPRQFLKEFVTVLDLVEQEPDFDPARAYSFERKDLSPAEERLVTRQPPFDPEPGDEKGYAPANLEW